jgi:hypothetical protein
MKVGPIDPISAAKWEDRVKEDGGGGPIDSSVVFGSRGWDGIYHGGTNSEKLGSLLLIFHMFRNDEAPK